MTNLFFWAVVVAAAPREDTYAPKAIKTHRRASSPDAPIVRDVIPFKPKDGLDGPPGPLFQTNRTDGLSETTGDGAEAEGCNGY
jgi:hypothetical protein